MITTEEYNFTHFTPSGASLIVRGVLDDLPPKTLSIDCDTIILNKKDLDISFKLDAAKIENFDRIIINGITFIQDRVDK